jgi:hypothetical protein
MGLLRQRRNSTELGSAPDIRFYRRYDRALINWGINWGRKGLWRRRNNTELGNAPARPCFRRHAPVRLCFRRYDRALINWGKGLWQRRNITEVGNAAPAIRCCRRCG